MGMGAPTADVSWVYHPETLSKAKTAQRPMAVSPEEVIPVALLLGPEAEKTTLTVGSSPAGEGSSGRIGGLAQDTAASIIAAKSLDLQMFVLISRIN